MTNKDKKNQNIFKNVNKQKNKINNKNNNNFLYFEPLNDPIELDCCSCLVFLLIFLFLYLTGKL